MKRFLMLVGVAVVAAAVYVAASPASQRASGPTAKQFSALKKQVATLTKNEKAAKKEADTALGFIASCLASANSGILGVGQFGTASNGFLFGATSGTATPRTALDAVTPDPANPNVALLIAVDPSCVNSSGLSHAGSGLQLHRLRVR